MPIKKHINLNLGSFLNPVDKKIVVNLASEDILTLITQELKTRYSPETQKQLLEESSQLFPDFVLQELLKRQEQVVNVTLLIMIFKNYQSEYMRQSSEYRKGILTDKPKK
ncbi:MAG: hypothetical protein RM347_033015 [Nostoc sp. ChiQUE02]|uniref:hypothetical protein n=1 Tax=Nostoc sp. ChiQUE02 TaxID=3075377 RepID=UPI002AD59027|nr:hypothetical protein [Nostoc sp. ChiQUE02]MDZ8233496.1 hypothetical protein [Nostoc sp. ChiQUE02]